MSIPLVRIAGAQLAAQGGFDLDRVEDVRIALGEAARILIGSGDPGPAGVDRRSLHTEFAVDARGFTVAMWCSGAPVSTTMGPEAAAIFSATTTSCDLEDDADGRSTIRARFDAEDPT